MMAPLKVMRLRDRMQKLYSTLAQVSLLLENLFREIPSEQQHHVNVIRPHLLGRDHRNV